MAELIRDRYEPLQVVGAGGQSTVLQARDHDRDRLVALKVRPRQSPEDEGSLLSEARILLGLDPHPLLCRVREDFFAGDRYFLVMDWVEGTTLADLVTEAGGGLPLVDVVRYLGQVAEALDHLHRHRPPVVHGDVKPANVIVAPEGKAVLVDFGISHREHAGDARPPLVPAGTAGYAAPEVASGQPPTPASDVFSLAATAFALLTGRPPRPGVRPAWTGIDPERARLVEFALRRGLSLDPARRPATASALVDALQGQLRTPNNLRAPATPFVGRVLETAQVKALLGTTRLLTLTGAGGIGKSRLAVQVAADQLSEYPDGAYQVSVDEHDDVASGLRDALGATDLERSNVLLLLDGCEHALSACADLATALLAGCPHVRVLATSRRPLGCPAEVTYQVPPLPTPDLFRLPDLDQLGDYDAVRLFVDRAAEVAPGFDVRAGDAPGLAQICCRLDGIPLALELVAAGTGSTQLADLLVDVAARFPLLDGGRRSPDEQDGTVRTAVEWACEQLAEDERAALEDPSTAGGESLVALARRSLVSTDGTRWWVHDAIRHRCRSLR
ncbi:MAG: serine/threonine-protein kinase [Actinomycetota bacterium]|nr:serine/threonine-protein kinase [Actinomycetota bacterium]